MRSLNFVWAFQTRTPCNCWRQRGRSRADFAAVVVDNDYYWMMKEDPSVVAVVDVFEIEDGGVYLQTMVDRSCRNVR